MYITLRNAWGINEPLGGYLYMSMSSMNDGDRFNPMVIIAHPEFPIQISKIITSVELCGTL